MNRFLGMMCAFLALVSAIVALTNMSWSWSWGLLVLWTIVLGLWAGTGWQKIEIGWRGQLLFLGERMDSKFEEGWRWVPWPFGVKVADCRQTVVKLDPLEKIITKDNVQVEIDGTIIRQIVDLNRYFGVEESGIKQGLDDIWDETIRTRVADTDLANVLKMHTELGQAAHDSIGERASADWGINILRVVIAGIKPDSKVADDLALKERENLQRTGQLVEAAHVANLTILFEKKKEDGGAGMTHGEAVEMAQLITGKASQKSITGFTFSPEILEAIAKILGRK